MMKTSLFSAAIPLAFALMLSGPAGAAERNGQAPLADGKATARDVSGGACAGMTAIKFKADDGINHSTTSAEFVNLSGASVPFNQAEAGCAVVTFSAESYAEFGRLVFVRARLDGSKNALPDAIQFSGDDDEDGDGRWARSRSFTFIFPSVSAGDHTINIQFRSRTFGSRVYIGKHTTVVQHR